MRSRGEAASKFFTPTRVLIFHPMTSIGIKLELSHPGLISSRAVAKRVPQTCRKGSRRFPTSLLSFGVWARRAWVEDATKTFVPHDVGMVLPGVDNLPTSWCAIVAY